MNKRGQIHLDTMHMKVRIIRFFQVSIWDRLKLTLQQTTLSQTTIAQYLM